jgi:hypothetical protein
MRVLIGLVVVSLATSVALFFKTRSQESRIAELEEAMGKPSPGAAKTGAERGSNAVDSRDMESRLARLEAQLLKAQVNQKLAGAPGKSGVMNPYGEGPEKLVATEGQAAKQSDVLEVLESYDPQVRDRLKAVIQEEQDRLRDERWEMRNQRWAERTQKQIADFSEKAGLSAEQSAEISTLLNSERDQISALFQNARQDMSFGEARNKARELRENNDAKAKEILDEGQYTAFMDMRAESGFGGGRGRRTNRNQN